MHALTGENPLRCHVDSWRMRSRLLDAVADRADVSRTYALTLSFSGHVARRCAMADSRIKSVVWCEPHPERQGSR